MAKYPIVGSSPIESIRLVERFIRCKAGKSFTASSLPGHLLHLVVEGQAEQTSNGRRQKLIPGTLVWYHEDEWVEGRVLQEPWIYYAVNFHASALPPPDFDSRMARGYKKLAMTFHRLLEVWRKPSSYRRMYICQSLLLSLLANIKMSSGALSCHGEADGLWWEIESWGRRNIDRQISLSDICRHFHCSAKTVARACHSTLGLSPMRRLKEIRLSLAHGLVCFSDLRMSEIALRVGYMRVHEFSRDYRKAYGMAPTAERNLLK